MMFPDLRFMSGTEYDGTPVVVTRWQPVYTNGIFEVPVLLWRERARRLAGFPYVWAWDSRPLPSRKGERCRVLVRGSMNSALVEFITDGYRVVTSRNGLRRAPIPAGGGSTVTS